MYRHINKKLHSIIKTELPNIIVRDKILYAGKVTYSLDLSNQTYYNYDQIEEIKQVIQIAFDTWSKIYKGNIIFIPTDTNRKLKKSNIHIHLGFSSKESHLQPGEKYILCKKTMSNDEIAHTNINKYSICFNNNLIWSSFGKENTYSFYFVALHEIGHLMGFEHTRNLNKDEIDIMAEDYHNIPYLISQYMINYDKFYEIITNYFQEENKGISPYFQNFYVTSVRKRRFGNIKEKYKKFNTIYIDYYNRCVTILKNNMKCEILFKTTNNDPPYDYDDMTYLNDKKIIIIEKKIKNDTKLPLDLIRASISLNQNTYLMTDNLIIINDELHSITELFHLKLLDGGFIFYKDSKIFHIIPHKNEINTYNLKFKLLETNVLLNTMIYVDALNFEGQVLLIKDDLSYDIFKIDSGQAVIQKNTHTKNIFTHILNNIKDVRYFST